jgi:hypothetical protein
MVAWSAVTRQHVLAAIHEYDEAGQTAFLERYGFAPAKDYVLRHANNSYESKAIVGAALGYATGTAGTSEEMTAGKTGATKMLRNLEFDVLSPAKAATAEVVPTTSIPNARRTNGIEPVVAVCPRCFLALSANGECDNCD